MPLAAIGAIISAGAGIFGAVSANKKANEQLSIEKQLAAKQQELIDQQKKGAELGYSKAQEFLPKGAEYLDLVGSNWKKIFSGSRDDVNAALAPDVNNYLKQMNAQQKTLGIFSGRGAIGDRLINSQFDKIGYLTNLRFGARNAAATNLFNIGQTYNTAGLNALSIAGGQAANASSQLLGSQQLAANNAAAYSAQAQSLGASLGTLVSSLNWKAKNIGSIFGSNKSPSPDSGSGTASSGADGFY